MNGADCLIKLRQEVGRRTDGLGSCYLGRKKQNQTVLEEGLEPSRGLRPFGFSYHYSFRYPCGLWSGLSLGRGDDTR